MKGVSEKIKGTPFSFVRNQETNQRNKESKQ